MSFGSSVVSRRSARLPIVTIQDVAELGTILSVWAHPDDEAYLCGGLMAARRRRRLPGGLRHGHAG